MSQVYNPESDLIAEIEKLEGEARELKRKLDHVTATDDRRVITEQLDDVRGRISYLQRKLP